VGENKMFKNKFEILEKQQNSALIECIETGELGVEEQIHAYGILKDRNA
jgi:hypothetical protein